MAAKVLFDQTRTRSSLAEILKLDRAVEGEKGLVNCLCTPTLGFSGVYCVFDG